MAEEWPRPGPPPPSARFSRRSSRRSRRSSSARRDTHGRCRRCLASGGRERPSAALNTIVSPMTPAQVTASTSTGAGEGQAMPSSRPTASAMTAIPASRRPRAADPLHRRGERRCPVRRDEPGHRGVGQEHRYPVTVGDIIHQLAQRGRGQRDGGQWQDEQQHECALPQGPVPAWGTWDPGGRTAGATWAACQPAGSPARSRSRWWATPTRSTRPPSTTRPATVSRSPAMMTVSSTGSPVLQARACPQCATQAG